MQAMREETGGWSHWNNLGLYPGGHYDVQAKAGRKCEPQDRGCCTESNRLCPDSFRGPVILSHGLSSSDNQQAIPEILIDASKTHGSNRTLINTPEWQTVFTKPFLTSWELTLLPFLPLCIYLWSQDTEMQKMQERNSQFPSHGGPWKIAAQKGHLTCLRF